MDKASSKSGASKVSNEEKEEKPKKGNAKTKTETKTISPEEEETPILSRRTRTGNKEQETPDTKKPGSNKKGRKRKLSAKHDDSTDFEPPAKKENLEKTPLKNVAQNSSPSKSPAGVNRRTAVLFTRKKQQAAEANDESKSEETPTKSGGKNKKIQNLSEDALENQETEVQSQASGSEDKPIKPPLGGKKRGRKPKALKEQLEKEKKEAEEKKLVKEKQQTKVNENKYCVIL